MNPKIEPAYQAQTRNWKYTAGWSYGSYGKGKAAQSWAVVCAAPPGMDETAGAARVSNQLQTLPYPAPTRGNSAEDQSPESDYGRWELAPAAVAVIMTTPASRRPCSMFLLGISLEFLLWSLFCCQWHHLIVILRKLNMAKNMRMF